MTNYCREIFCWMWSPMISIWTRRPWNDWNVHKRERHDAQPRRNQTLNSPSPQPQSDIRDFDPENRCSRPRETWKWWKLETGRTDNSMLMDMFWSANKTWRSSVECQRTLLSNVKLNMILQMTNLNLNLSVQFQEDHNRIVRYFLFCAGFSFQPDLDKLKIIQENAEGITKVFSQRIWMELKKLVFIKDAVNIINWKCYIVHSMQDFQRKSLLTSFKKCGPGLKILNKNWTTYLCWLRCSIPPKRWNWFNLTKFKIWLWF